MKWDFPKYFGGFHDSCIGRGSVNFDSSTTVSAISKAVNYRNVKSCARTCLTRSEEPDFVV